MGTFGFLAAMAYRRERHLPRGYLRALLINIGLIAAVGLVAWRYIDNANAAHAGGLLAGALMALVTIPDDRNAPDWAGGPRLEWAGRLAVAGVWLWAAIAIGCP